MSDRRSEKRVKVYWPVTIIRTDKSRLVGRSVNISPNGIQVALSECLVKGERVLVCVNAYFEGKRHDCCFVGQVSYVAFRQGHDVLVGIEVKSPSEGYAKAIREYLKNKV